MKAITGSTIFVLTLFSLTACQHAPVHSSGDGQTTQQTNYKSDIEFTTKVEYYEPVFNY
jgi:hypothetical protein